MKWKIEAEVKVRFVDVDWMGHVNNAHYFTYFEQARIAYFKNFSSLDFTSPHYQVGKSVIVASISCNFLSPAYLDEVLKVKIRTLKLGRSSFVLEYEMTETKTERLVATGESVMVYFDYKTQKSEALPQEIREQIESLEGRKLD